MATGTAPLMKLVRYATLLLLAHPFAWAGQVKVMPDLRVECANGQAVAHIQLFNSGGEPVQVLAVEADVLSPGREQGARSGQDLTTPVLLPPGEFYRRQIRLSPVRGRPGTYPVVSRIRCADQAGAAFSAVVVADLASDGGVAAPWISITVKPASIGRQGRVQAELLLLEDETAEVDVSLVLPEELGRSTPRQRVVLEPYTSRVVALDIASRGAMPGSVCTIHAVVEQDAIGRHRSATASSTVAVTRSGWVGQSPWAWFIGALVLVGAGEWGTRRMGRRRGGETLPNEAREASPPSRYAPAFDGLILAGLAGFIFWHLSPADLVRDTTAVGGDTPAHLYLLSHLKEQLFHHGRILSWADGWWCGFPMFQYYFVLPYLVAALLSVLMPLNVAFKLVSVAGLVMTPLCAYWAGRLWALSRPVPLLLAIAMVPFLFVQTHVMWGVNTASTLAGMIANSWSFALMLPALASGCRDAAEGQFRLRTVALMGLVLASHFFTSVMMFLSLAIMPFLARRRKEDLAPSREGARMPSASVTRSRVLGPGRGSRSWILDSGFWILFCEGGLALLLMAWWWVPLVAKAGWSMEFGTNWDVTLWRSFPAYAAGLAVFAVWGTCRHGKWLMGDGASSYQPSTINHSYFLLWMLLVSVLLFQFGFSLSPVFVNVRLWPFIWFALVALGAVGIGRWWNGQWLMVDDTHRHQPSTINHAFVLILALLVLLGVHRGDSLNGTLTGPGLTRSWAKWNFSGLEGKPGASVFQKLVLPLRGTPGRLANDLCEENNQLGSSRVFELAPHLAGKPVLEGGLVNSALGSMYAYTVQGETSRSCAGFPPIVTPQPFNFTNATRHLALFNVKHFIARSEMAKQALRQQPEWRLIGREQEWELYELTTHAGRLVSVPAKLPIVVETRRWRENSLEWLATPGALDQYVIWSDGADRGSRALPDTLLRVNEQQFRDLLANWRREADPMLAPDRTAPVREEVVRGDSILFRTSAIGEPHLIKMSWFPNWKVRGARAVHRVSPGFMLVIPEQERVELYYGAVWSDWLGYGLTALGAGVLVFAGRRR